MGKTIARQALYDAVWAQPMTRLSKEFGVSDVGLAKACRKLSVPIPPRGYWARKAAGKPVIQAALPPRPPGLGDETTIGGGGGTGWGWSGPPLNTQARQFGCRSLGLRSQLLGTLVQTQQSTRCSAA